MHVAHPDPHRAFLNDKWRGDTMRQICIAQILHCPWCRQFMQWQVFRLRKGCVGRQEYNLDGRKSHLRDFGLTKQNYIRQQKTGVVELTSS